MPCRRIPPALFLFACLLAWAPTARGHQVPNMSVEADFARNRSFELRINLDPRVVLSDQPTSLPPVPANWYFGLTDTEKTQMLDDVRGYLRKNVELVFGAETVPLPDLKITAIDGADNMPLRQETLEVHLLATGKTVIPRSAAPFSVRVGKDANVSMILLNRMEGQGEPALRVIFPGETSQEFVLTGVRSIEDVLGIAAGKPARTSIPIPWIIRAGMVAMIFIMWIIAKARRRSIQPQRFKRR